MAEVGFSTGCLYKSGLDLTSIAGIYDSVGAGSIEIGFGTGKELMDFQVTDEFLKRLKGFSLVTIHAPWVNTDYTPENPFLLTKLKYLTKEFDAKGVVFHPDRITPSLEHIASFGLPALIENMDKRKTIGISPDYFDLISKTYPSLNFVLDLQHCYEHDPTMKLAEELIGVMGNRLSHMHVSGTDGKNIHNPTFSSVNRAAIERILENGITVPIIGEGLISEKDPQEVFNSLQTELDYLRSYS